MSSKSESPPGGQSGKQPSKRTALAFLSGALFLLAGVVASIGGLTRPSRPASSGLGASFAVAGMLWIAVGMNFLKRDLRRAESANAGKETP